MERSSELTTAKVKYTGLCDYKEGEGIVFLNKTSFTMRYEATARFGIDIAKVTIFG